MSDKPLDHAEAKPTPYERIVECGKKFAKNPHIPPQSDWKTWLELREASTEMAIQMYEGANEDCIINIQYFLSDYLQAGGVEKVPADTMASALCNMMLHIMIRLYVAQKRQPEASIPADDVQVADLEDSTRRSLFEAKMMP